MLAEAFAEQAGDGASVVNLLDQRVLKPDPRFFSYSLSRNALWWATRTLAQALAPRVRVNSVIAGPVETEQSALHYGDDAGVAAVGETIPMGRMATPADVGNAVAFLLSPLAGYITGSTLTVHGGGEKPAFLDAATAGNAV